MIHVHQVLYDNTDEKLPAFHILVVQITIPALTNMNVYTLT